jgi:hypothetical protein
MTTKEIKGTGLNRLSKDIFSGYFFRLTNRHIVALCNLSQRIGPQSVALSKSMRLDREADADLLRECADIGLAIIKDGYVTVPAVVQDALTEWLNMTIDGR